MRKFDTNVQELKYNVMKEVVKLARQDKLNDAYYIIPRKIVPDDYKTTRCCIYKAREVVVERTKMAMGGNSENPNIIENLSVACDQCRTQKYEISSLCRGCISHPCQDVCRFGAISFSDQQKAIIDPTICKECGKCKNVCPYGAIIEHVIPCMVSCKVKAISMNKDNKAVIDNDKCVMCGACVYNCPFGAISDKSFILNVVDILKKSNNNQSYKVYAIIAPAIVSQFKYAKIGQIVSGIKMLGFHNVVEVALGADIVLANEVEELARKQKLTTSCCPSFVMTIEKYYPNLKQLISHNPSPMIETAKLIKMTDPSSKVVFIGPCISKKQEIKRIENQGIVDAVITFEELQSLLDGFDISVEELAESELNNGSYYGRIFAKSSGITEGANKLMNEINPLFKIEPLILNGLDEIKLGLLKVDKGIINNNFIEGMACFGGCINGAGCLHHGDKNVHDVEVYASEAKEKNVYSSYSIYNLYKWNNKNS